MRDKCCYGYWYFDGVIEGYTYCTRKRDHKGDHRFVVEIDHKWHKLHYDEERKG